MAVVRSWIHLCLEDNRPRRTCVLVAARQSRTAERAFEMDARSVWFRETGEGRPKEQLLIETMFCVYYLSKDSAFRVTRALHLRPSFLNTFSSLFEYILFFRAVCGSRTSPVGNRQRVSRPARQPSLQSLPLRLILTRSCWISEYGQRCPHARRSVSWRTANRGSGADKSVGGIAGPTSRKNREVLKNFYNHGQAGPL